MAKQPTICSLSIENLKPVTRSIANSILGPYKSNLVHFKTLTQVNYAIVLEEANQIRIKSDIPQHILSQLNGPSVPKESAPIQEEVSSPTPAEEVVVPAEEVVAPVGEIIFSEEVKEKPEWYLTWQEVEDKTKSELIDWSEDVEGLKISKSKNAAEVTKIAHDFLSSQFADHVAE